MRRLITALIVAGLLAIATTVPAFAVGGPLGSQVDKVVNACNPQGPASCDTCEGAIDQLVEAARPGE